MNVFAGNNTAMRMYYDGLGEPLVIRMEDEGIVFNCEISTQIPSQVKHINFLMNLFFKFKKNHKVTQRFFQILDFEFHQADVRAKCIMAPNIMKEIVREFDLSSPTVLITLTQSYISFYTDGDLGKFKVITFLSLIGVEEKRKNLNIPNCAKQIYENGIICFLEIFASTFIQYSLNCWNTKFVHFPEFKNSNLFSLPLQAEIPSHSEQVEFMECLDGKCSFSYRLSLIKKMAPTFALCNKVSIRMNGRGTLSVQFLVPQCEQESIFVEFYVSHATFFRVFNYKFLFQCVSDTDVGA